MTNFTDHISLYVPDDYKPEPVTCYFIHVYGHNTITAVGVFRLDQQLQRIKAPTVILSLRLAPPISTELSAPCCQEEQSVNSHSRDSTPEPVSVTVNLPALINISWVVLLLQTPLCEKADVLFCVLNEVEVS